MWQLMHTFCTLLLHVGQDCGTPPDADPNGGVTYPDTMDGSIARYRCNFGYMAQGGSISLTCVSGTWSPPNAASCNGELKMVHIGLKNCLLQFFPKSTGFDCGPIPAADPNGDVDLAQDTTFMSMITYTCDPGYIAVGSTTLTCLVGGKNFAVWFPMTAPTCAGELEIL